jgi:hypothetical protein
MIQAALYLGNRKNRLLKQRLRAPTIVIIQTPPIPSGKAAAMASLIPSCRAPRFPLQLPQNKSTSPGRCVLFRSGRRQKTWIRENLLASNDGRRCAAPILLGHVKTKTLPMWCHCCKPTASPGVRSTQCLKSGTQIVIHGLKGW